MGELVWLAVVAAIAFGVRASRNHEQARRSGWRRALRDCGLSDLEGSDALRARAGRLLVRLARDYREDESPRQAIRISVEGSDEDLVPVTVRASGRATAFQRKTAVPSGDPSFDGAVVVSGPSLVVQAALDENTRTLLRALVDEAGLRFDFGSLKVRIPEPSLSQDLERHHVAEALRRLLDAAGRLRPKPDLPAAIAHNARHDHVADVRERNLVALATSFPSFPLTAETLREAMRDPSDAVRVRAAVLLGEPGRSTLMEVATRQGAQDGPAADAVRALGQRMTLPQAEDILHAALRSRRLQTALACLETLGWTHAPAAVPILAKALAMEKGEIAAAAARALAETGLPDAQGPLVDALARDDGVLRKAAAEALGRIGTAAAVLPLQEVEAHSREAVVRGAARLAVVAIQSRLRGASPGQLSLASPASSEGRLSLAGDPHGRLSLEPEAASPAPPPPPDGKPPRGR